MAIVTNLGHKAPTPGRMGFATSRARGPTFAQLSRGGPFALTIPNAESWAPFTGPNAEALSKKFGHYKFSAQGCIKRALDEPQIAVHLADRSEATAPELVVLGDALLDGYQLGRDLFFQTPTFRDPVFNPSGHSFPVDILKRPHADSWLIPVDGVHFHLATAEEIAHDAIRNGWLQSYGHVVVVTDQSCQSREDLRAYLHSQGAP